MKSFTSKTVVYPFLIELAWALIMALLECQSYSRFEIRFVAGAASKPTHPSHATMHKVEEQVVTTQAQLMTKDEQKQDNPTEAASTAPPYQDHRST